MKPKSTTAPHKGKRGFSLIEIVIALAMMAVAIPAIISMFGVFTKISVETRDRDDLRSIINEVTLFLENEADHTPTGKHFATVYDWVRKASQNPELAQVLYVYTPAGNEEDLIQNTLEPVVKQGAPTEIDISLMDSRIVAVEIAAPPENILAKTKLTSSVSDYPKSYLPLELHIYGLTTVDEPRSKSNFLDSFNIVLSR